MKSKYIFLNKYGYLYKKNHWNFKSPNFTNNHIDYKMIGNQLESKIIDKDNNILEYISKELNRN